jgi:hypothetical protein
MADWMRKDFLQAGSIGLAAFAFAGACGKLGEHKKALVEAASQVRYTAACRKMVPMEYARSYPLPLYSDAGPSFRLFFYPLKTKFLKGRSMPVAEALAPVVAARFASDGTGESCERFSAPLQLDPGVTLGPRVPPEAAILGVRQFEMKQAELYALEEGVAAAYFAQDGSDAARQAVGDFFDLFFVISEPGLKPYYYYLSPDFWQWVEKMTGRKVFEA